MSSQKKDREFLPITSETLAHSSGGFYFYFIANQQTSRIPSVNRSIFPSRFQFKQPNPVFFK